MYYEVGFHQRMNHLLLLLISSFSLSVTAAVAVTATAAIAFRGGGRELCNQY
jgi:hypothetical protein